MKRNGKVIRRMPMSAGQGGVWKYYTTSGVHLAMSREPVTVMTSPGIGPGSAGYYQLTVYNTVRISNSGEYIHSAPWSVGSQGYSNVSHGCVNVSPDNAKWFIDNTLIGDPIIITGSPRPLEPTNGWGHWQERLEAVAQVEQRQALQNRGRLNGLDRGRPRYACPCRMSALSRCQGPLRSPSSTAASAVTLPGSGIAMVRSGVRRRSGRRAIRRRSAGLVQPRWSVSGPEGDLSSSPGPMAACSSWPSPGRR